MSSLFFVLFSSILAFLITYFSIPSLIEIARRNDIFDEPNKRSSHVLLTPFLGGIGIFLGIIISFFVFAPIENIQSIQSGKYLLIAIIVMFSIGLKDDLTPTKPFKKLLGQIITAGFVVAAGICLTNLQGILGIGEIPEVIGIGLTVLSIVYIINAFNLIDGINGLSAGIGIWLATFLGSWFLLISQLSDAILAFSVVGALLAFLKYNRTPAKIFMGDSGSLLIGLFIAILLIKFVQLHALTPNNYYFFDNAPLIATGVFAIPLFDFLRVVSERFLFGKSPMSPDRKHIHHLFVDAGYSHDNSSKLIVLMNILFAFFAFLLEDFGFILPVLLLFISFCIIISYLKTKVILYREVKAVKKESNTMNTKVFPVEKTNLQVTEIIESEIK